MLKLNLPEYAPKVVNTAQGPKIFDPLQRKYLALTPEEWVRQHQVHYMMDYKGFSNSRLVLEKGLRLAVGRGRFDILYFGRTGHPLYLVECKAPYVRIDSSTLEQATQYNRELKAPFVTLTNGMEHWHARMRVSRQGFDVFSELPSADEMESYALEYEVI